MTAKERDELREKLYKRDGKSGHNCHYCGIDEVEFREIWRGLFYKTRGKKLEIDHKDNNIKDDTLENCVLACAICNCSKSNKFTYEEFKRVGKVINQIWNERYSELRKKEAS